MKSPHDKTTPVVVTLDFETYYDRDYSLSKMTTQEYIHDPRFEIIGMAYQVNGLTMWHVGHDGVADGLCSLVDQYDNIILVCHNAMFDYSIITAKFPFFRPSLVLCTMSMARSLGIDQKAGASLAKMAEYFQSQGIAMPNKGTEVTNALGKRLADFTEAELAAYGSYCRTDVDICQSAFKAMVKLLPREELLWQDRVIRMHAEPSLVLNRLTLEQDLIRVKARKAQILADVANVVGAESEAELLKQLRSNDKFAELLRSFGVTPPTKVSATTGKTTYAFAKTDEAMQQLLEHPDPRVSAVVEARLGTKSSIEETRLEKFISLSTLPRFAIPLTVSGAHTHRLGGCVTSDTEVTVKDVFGVERTCPIVLVRPEDLVWDGENFVRHDGVAYCGDLEVMTYDGITATHDHKVFISEAEAIPLKEAADKKLEIIRSEYV